MSWSACKKLGFLGSYDQNMIVFTIFAELLILFATKLGLMVHFHEPECLMEKWDCCVQGEGHSKFQNVNECLSG